jgi:hypothetical protein
MHKLGAMRRLIALPDAQAQGPNTDDDPEIRIGSRWKAEIPSSIVTSFAWLPIWTFLEKRFHRLSTKGHDISYTFV